MNCKDCNRRELGCHSRCEDYIRWKDKYNADKQAIEDAKNREKEYFNYKGERKWKKLKK